VQVVHFYVEQGSLKNYSKGFAQVQYQRITNHMHAWRRTSGNGTHRNAKINCTDWVI